MKILVTGATGFIGHHVIKALSDRGHEIIATGRKDASDVPDFTSHADVKYTPCDLDETNTDFFKLFGKPEAVIHLAWHGLPNYRELFHFEKNLFSSYLCLKNLIENGMKNVTVIGTCFEYGMKTGALNEDMPSDPNLPYPFAKDTLRKFLTYLCQKHDCRFRWIRLFYMYGEGQDPNSLLSQLDRALANKENTFNMSGGKQVRDYLPVETVAEYIVKISLQDKVLGIINCCSGEPITVKDFVERYLKSKNQKIELNLGYYPYPDYEPMAFWGDNRKLKKALEEFDKLKQ